MVFSLAERGHRPGEARRPGAAAAHRGAARGGHRGSHAGHVGHLHEVDRLRRDV